jgi:hypothetical protein
MVSFVPLIRFVSTDLTIRLRDRLISDIHFSTRIFLPVLFRNSWQISAASVEIALWFLADFDSSFTLFSFSTIHTHPSSTECIQPFHILWGVAHRKPKVPELRHILFVLASTPFLTLVGVLQSVPSKYLDLQANVLTDQSVWNTLADRVARRWVSGSIMRERPSRSSRRGAASLAQHSPPTCIKMDLHRVDHSDIVTKMGLSDIVSINVSIKHHSILYMENEQYFRGRRSSSLLQYYSLSVASVVTTSVVGGVVS